MGSARLTPRLSFQPLSHHEELFLLGVPGKKLCVASADKNQEKECLLAHEDGYDTLETGHQIFQTTTAPSKPKRLWQLSMHSLG